MKEEEREDLKEDNKINHLSISMHVIKIIKIDLIILNIVVDIIYKVRINLINIYYKMISSISKVNKIRILEVK
jgi:hypothetical protein